MKSKGMTVLVNATVGGGRAVGTPRESPTHTGRKAEETVLEEVTSSGALKEEIKFRPVEEKQRKRMSRAGGAACAELPTP